MAGESPLCELALETFVGVYAAQAANLALTALATGGVYLGGGIAPAILPALQRSVFLRAFLAKGRVRDLLDGVPVKVVLDSKAPLYGAAVCAEKVS
jgi:glucokinase